MKKKILMSCLLAGILLSQTVFASSLDKVEYNSRTKTLRISGVTDKNTEFPLQAVTLRLFVPGKNPENIVDLNDTEKKASFAFVGQETPAEDGSFTFSYKTEEIIPGNHKLYLTDAKGDVFSDYVLILEQEEETSLFTALNGAKNKEAMLGVFSAHPYFLENIAEIEEIASAYPDVDLTAEIAGMLAGKIFSDNEKALHEAIRSAVTAGINATDSAEDFIALLKKYQKELGISESEVYTKLFADSKNLAEKLVKTNYADADKFVTGFFDRVILELMNDNMNAGGVMTVLETAKDYLSGFRFADYEKLTKKQKDYVQKQIAEGADYESISEMERTFHQAITDAPKKTASDKTNGGGGGGGSSSGGSSAGAGGMIGVSKVPAKDTEQAVFSDLSSVSWAEESILSLYEKGIISGVGEQRFDPQGLVTREQFAKMLVSAYALHDRNATCDFSDVVSGSWYESYVASAVNHAIVFGVSDKLFGTGGNITREDMAVMAFRASRLAEAEATDLFADDEQISAYAKTAVYTLKQKQIMSGKGENCFEPKAFATRAEAAKMIHGLIGLEVEG